MSTLNRYLRNASLVYHTAFDLCAAAAFEVEGPVAVMASSLFHARELLKRIEGEAFLFPFNGSGMDLKKCRLELDSELIWERVKIVHPDDPLPRFDLAIWAEPHSSNASQTLGILTKRLQAKGRCIVITTSRLRFFLPEWVNVDRKTIRGLLGLRRTKQLLTYQGFQIQQVNGLQGPASLAYGALAHLAALLNLQDMTDRFTAGMRRSLCTSGLRSNLAPLALLVARKEG